LVTQKLFEKSCYEFSLGDTVGKGTPEKVEIYSNKLPNFQNKKITVHFQDSY